MLVYDNRLTTTEYRKLREGVEWMALPEEQARAVIKNSDFMAVCRDGEAIVGCARIFWDKAFTAYLSDVMVMPEYQGKGIGRELVSRCLDYLKAEKQEGWLLKVVIVVAKDKEPFYEKLGFVNRPNEAYGAGMHLFLE